MKVGDSIVFVNAVGQQQPAIVTAIWGKAEDLPCINVVVTSLDDAKTDSYGRQIERHTSVVHRMKQAAHGYYYMQAGDVPNPVAPVQA